MRGASLLLGACGVAAALMLWRWLASAIPAPPDGADIAGRLSLALAWLLPGAGILWAMLMAQMAGRFILGRFDPLAGMEARLLAVNQRVITNTVEQGAVFVPALLALAAGAPDAWMPQVLALPASSRWRGACSGRAIWPRRLAGRREWQRRWWRPRARWPGRFGFG